MSSILSRLMPFFAAPAAADSEAPPSAAASAAPSEAKPVRPTAAQMDFLLEEEIDDARLLALFRQAFVEVQSVAQGRLRVVGDNGVKMMVKADPECRVIFFSAWFGLKADSPMSAKLAFVNRANERFMFVRCSVTDESTLLIDYHLPYTGGLPATLVVNMVRRLPRVMAQAIAEQDIDHVVG
jgi:putative sensory transduction regulator